MSEGSRAPGTEHVSCGPGVGWGLLSSGESICGCRDGEKRPAARLRIWDGFTQDNLWLLSAEEPGCPGRRPAL